MINLVRQGQIETPGGLWASRVGGGESQRIEGDDDNSLHGEIDFQLLIARVRHSPRLCWGCFRGLGVDGFEDLPRDPSPDPGGAISGERRRRRSATRPPTGRFRAVQIRLGAPKIHPRDGSLIGSGSEFRAAPIAFADQLWRRLRIPQTHHRHRPSRVQGVTLNRAYIPPSKCSFT
jgi:hypothetical protein